MCRTFSLIALSTLLLATAVEAYPGGDRGTDGYGGFMDQRKSAGPMRSAANGPSDNKPLQGDNCGAEGYPWLDQHGQPVEG